jgi:hypothetical protein
MMGSEWAEGTTNGREVSNREMRGRYGGHSFYGKKAGGRRQKRSGGRHVRRRKRR